MPLPPPEPLFEELLALRDAADPTAPEHEARWRRVADWLESAFAGKSAEAEDARQETLISLLRHVGGMQAVAPLQAAKWVSTIHRRKRVDALRARKADPVRQAMAREPRDPKATPLLERVEAEDTRRLTPAMLERLVTSVLEQVHLAVEASVKSPRKRLLRRTQAQATLLRLVCGWDAEAIIAALDHGEPIGKDRLYKWVERGRAPVREGLERWMREDPESRDVAEVLLEIVDERRADAGKPRPDRRKQPEDPA